MKGEEKERLHPVHSILKDFFPRFYAAQGRTFPWRMESTSPFGILVAEILLKQTRAEKVAKVWPSLVARYVDATELSSADPGELFRMVTPLGFGNQRTVALIALATAIEQTGGTIPASPGDLVKLPYVGVYTAHAVACFAYDQRVPIVDLSVVRLISRVEGIQPPSDIRRAGKIWDVAWTWLPQQNFKEHNYGLLDFATAVCKPRSPCCRDCPLSINCAYGKISEPGVHESH